MQNLSIGNTGRSFYIPHTWTDREIRIALVGCGGTGSAMLTELFQMHGVLTRLGGQGFHVTAYDGDTVSDSNVFRQNFWQHDIGLNKAEVLISRFNQFGGIDWDFEPSYFTTDDAQGGGFDLLITAVDKASVRAEIGAAMEKYKAKGLWLDMGNDNHQANVLLGSLTSAGTGSEQRLPSPYELFGSQWAKAAETEVDTASCSTEEAISKQTFGVNGMTARSAASMLLFPLLRNGKLEHHGLFIDLHRGDISNMPVDPLQWSLYGYSEEKPEAIN